MNDFVIKRDKLIEFGFAESSDGFKLVREIMQGQLRVEIVLNNDGEINSSVTDTATGEPYLLHLVETASGAFVGEVRSELESLMREIEDNCLDKRPFGDEVPSKIIEHVKNTYGDELEFLWDDLPDAAIWRRKDNRKWYGLIMTIPRSRLKLSGDGLLDIIDMRVEDGVLEEKIDNARFFPAYHMNKKHWITILLDGSVSPEEICGMLDESYNLAKKK